MKKAVALLALSVALTACKKEEPYDFGSSTAQATGTVRAPEQPENPPITTMAGTGPAATSAAPSTDAQFVQKAAIGGLAEVQLGQLAQTKATSADVKQFARMMVTDHTAANNELTQIATAKAISLPTDLDAEHKAVRDRLNTLSGAEFDREYMAAMVKDHNDAVTTFQTEANGGSDPELKAFAAKTLPKLQEHQRMATETSAKTAGQ